MSSTLLAAGDHLIKLWPQAKLTFPARESHGEDVGGYNLLILFSHDPKKTIFRIRISYFMIIRKIMQFF